jgi:hypothetical protein
LKTTLDSPQAPAGASFRATRRFRSNRESLARCAAAGVCLLLLVGASTGISLAANRDEKKPPPFALIYGTVYGPDDRPLYGVPVKIRRSDKKKAQWEMMSDHRGEFAVRVPPGPADYIVWTDVKLSKLLGREKSEKQAAKARKAKDADKASDPQSGTQPVPASPQLATPPKSVREVKVHVDNDERVDMGLHLTE